eukprot:m.169125 g.169125  ORF g.169125 m.169125 type:complete len:64 (-) comp18230_c0_seq1:65-256(-)
MFAATSPVTSKPLLVPDATLVISLVVSATFTYIEEMPLFARVVYTWGLLWRRLKSSMSDSVVT